MKKFLVMGGVSLLMPAVVLAADLTTILTKVQQIIGLIVPIVISLAVILFLWGLIGFITKAGADQKAAREQMIWGIIILFVMVSIWGLVALIQNTFGIRGTEGTVTNPLDKIENF
ncbi:TPA: hypothetical protein DCZ46_03990 [Candidatus Campbellbacteria bacterium]|nr:MAG: protein of unknown function with transmembrane region [Candidatus Campbellbacteria bacterium GW2011_OD1_34_28]KKP74996.1 MAG: hypothetical protein UR74_C0002G0262 [Candidatus Campbellbacteria bacterium GW2011_GWD2_35_24]KKP75882.1 MAG: hypothetical protein UR75_C0002G0263 [Candidatus Campbellbacteria bacterium GW2011_GWC2_35_28]KKP76870.1 MAG: hypothetical protein UR76_C0002G0071 [Candidatus Campbellbacteria bacterium GW2011_GWC1_35_31]KKP78796.1 MAG: hypothetical protein UR79_C0002G007